MACFIDSLGCYKFAFYGKLKILKCKLMELNREELCYFLMKVFETKTSFESIQRTLTSSRRKVGLVVAEKEAISKYYHYISLEENFFKQKLRVYWLQLGDIDSAFLFNSLKWGQSRNLIDSLRLNDGSII